MESTPTRHTEGGLSDRPLYCSLGQEPSRIDQISCVRLRAQEERNLGTAENDRRTPSTAEPTDGLTRGIPVNVGRREFEGAKDRVVQRGPE